MDIDNASVAVSLYNWPTFAPFQDCLRAALLHEQAQNHRGMPQ